MTTMHAFDTLAFAKKLKSAGYSEAQAEALAEAQGEVFREMLNSTLATKDDLRELATKEEIGKLDQRIDQLDQRVDQLDQRVGHLEVRIDGVVNQITVRLGGMIAVGIGLLAAMRFFG